MPTIKLKCFEKDTHLSYRFETESGEYEKVTHSDSRSAADHAQGFGSIRRIGLRRRKSVFVAEYSLDGLVNVALARSRFFWPGPYRARRRYRRLGGPVKAFSVDEEAFRLVQFHYWFHDGGSWPGAEALDIFAHIAFTTASPERVHRFAFLWAASGRGENVDTEEFYDRADKYLRQRAGGCV